MRRRGVPWHRAVALWRLAALVLTVAAAFALAALLVPHSAENLRGAVADLGPLAPVAFVLATAALTCALFPFPVLAAASGLLFATALGTVVAIAGGWPARWRRSSSPVPGARGR